MAVLISSALNGVVILCVGENVGYVNLRTK